MQVINVVNGEMFTILNKFGDLVEINYYNSKLLVKLGDLWKLVGRKDNEQLLTRLSN